MLWDQRLDENVVVYSYWIALRLIKILNISVWIDDAIGPLIKEGEKERLLTRIF